MTCSAVRSCDRKSQGCLYLLEVEGTFHFVRGEMVRILMLHRALGDDKSTSVTVDPCVSGGGGVSCLPCFSDLFE